MRLGKARSVQGGYAAAEKSWNRVIELEETADLISQSHFNAIHNVQARTPVENIVAMIDALHEVNGQK